MSRLRHSAMALSLLLALALVGGCTTVAQIRTPTTVAVNGGSPQMVRAAIVRAIQARGHWSVESEGPNMMVAVLNVRNHQARVSIDYTAQLVQISYLDSQNLDYQVAQDGTPFIHPNYNAWVQRLADEIHEQVEAQGQPVLVIQQ